MTSSSSPSSSVTKALVFGMVGLLYWYLLVLSAAIASSHPTWIPDWIPLTPGWPPSEADLAPAIDDSLHFFYLSDLLKNQWPAAAPLVTLRYALFNVAEAWIFAFLPLLLATNDSNRNKASALPTPLVLLTWLGGLGLTNAFLAPYLAIRECKGLLWNAKTASSEDVLAETAAHQETTISIPVKTFRVSVALITFLVVVIAVTQVLLLISNSSTDTTTLWQDWTHLVSSDRTYMAFVIDLILFGFFQSVLLDEVSQTSSSMIYKVPIVGILAWLVQ